MEKFTASYAYTNNNFVIQNLESKRDFKSKYFPVICVLKNILQRGNPTLMSKHLQKLLGKLHDDDRFADKLFLISNEKVVWHQTIKGDDERGYYPAKTFYDDIIPAYLPEYTQQLILPEVRISDITQKHNERFEMEQVDFYLPQARLVIEIDGGTHDEETHRITDNERDNYLAEHGVLVVRIKTNDIDNRSRVLSTKIKEIKERLEECKDKLTNYEWAYKNLSSMMDDEYNHKKLIADAIMRFQLTILSAIEHGMLSFSDDFWKINVIQNDISDFADIALEDLFIWLERLCKLNKIPYVKPQVSLSQCDCSIENYKPGYVNIDFSLFKRYTDENILKSKVILVRTDYFDDWNYFKVSVTDPIKYKIINDGVDSDILILEAMLHDIFGFEEFNPGQISIIVNALCCNDTIGLLPTGSGKSLCYQFTALLQPCVSFVVCPIKALMYDQEANIKRKHWITQNAYMSSDMTPTEREKVQNNFSKGKYQFIWISPERFQSKSFRQYLEILNQEQTIALAVIDEVHCLSEWGHNFRTSYLNLVKTIRKYCPSAWFLGLTATASSAVLQDLKVEFDIENINIKTLASFNRKELQFSVIKDPGNNRNQKFNNLLEILRGLNNEAEIGIFEVDGNNTNSGLVFTIFKNGRNGCYSLSNSLRMELDYPDIRWYSGSIPDVTTYPNGVMHTEPVMNSETFNDYKKKSQEDYMNNRFSLLVANKAFGMGIDKENIRYTIHYGLPNSLESLYQEAGRAGRDHKDANCYVLYSKENIDENLLDRLFDINASIEDIEEILQDVHITDQRDILGNFFLLLTNNIGVRHEYRIINWIMNNYVMPGEVKHVQANYNYKLSDLQKAIYRLSLLGIVKDWTIEVWSETQGMIEVTFSDYTDKSAFDSVINCIKKYDKEFDINQNYNGNQQYEKIIKLIHGFEDMPLMKKSICILLYWTYDNIVYGRRQALRTVMEHCDNFSTSEEFKKVIDGYFRFDESTFVIDNIIEEPQEFTLWFDVFFKGSERNFISLDGVNDLRNSLSRFLESYRYSTGLNFISGMISLIRDEYKSYDGEPRLDSAFKQIRTYSDDKKLIILESIFTLSEYMNDNNKHQLSDMLIKYYPSQLETIYEGLKDDNTLLAILDRTNDKLDDIMEGLI